MSFFPILNYSNVQRSYIFEFSHTFNIHGAASTFWKKILSNMCVHTFRRTRVITSFICEPLSVRAHKVLSLRLLLKLGMERWGGVQPNKARTRIHFCTFFRTSIRSVRPPSLPCSRTTIIPNKWRHEFGTGKGNSA